MSYTELKPCPPEECEKCVGTGTVEDAGRPIGMGGFMKCPDCNGTGHAPPAKRASVMPNNGDINR